MKSILAIALLLVSCCAQAQTITTYAGCCTGGGPVGDGGPATAAKLFDPISGTFDKYGNYYFVEGLAGNRIRKINTSNIITTICGTGISGFSGDNGPAPIANIHTPTSIVLDTTGNIFFVDEANNRVRRIDHTSGIITTICGNGSATSTGDGFPATAATLNNPADICFDKYGNLYIAEFSSARIRKITPSGVISHFAGVNGTPGYSGDGSRADTAKLGAVSGLAVDTSNNIYIADASNSRIFKVNTSGIITTYAGTSTGFLFNGDGIPATSANIDPVKIGFDQSGNLFIAENQNYRVRMIDGVGFIHTAAGTGISGFSGDNGPATAAQFRYPTGIAFDGCGNLYVPESANNRVRRIAYSANPTITLTGSTSVVLGGTVTVTATISNAGSGYSINWYNKGILFSTTAVPVTTYIKTAGTDSITAIIYGCGSSAPSGLHVVATDNSHTGINSIRQGAGNMVLFPNPVTALLHINNTQPGSRYTLYEMTGRAVASGIFDKQDNEIDMNHMAHGVYLLQVISSDGVREVRKVVKE